VRNNEVVPAWAGALAGIVAGAVALGVAQLAAGLIRPGAFPVVAVGDWVVDLSPAPLKEFAIRTFGENDKTVLVGGVFVVLALFTAAIGIAARHRRSYGTAGVLAFGAIGVAAVLTRPAATPVDALPTLLGVAAGAWTLSRLIQRAVTLAPVTTHSRVPSATHPPGTLATSAISLPATSATEPSGPSGTDASSTLATPVTESSGNGRSSAATDGSAPAPTEAERTAQASGTSVQSPDGAAASTDAPALTPPDTGGAGGTVGSVSAEAPSPIPPDTGGAGGTAGSVSAEAPAHTPSGTGGSDPAGAPGAVRGPAATDASGSALAAGSADAPAWGGRDAAERPPVMRAPGVAYAFDRRRLFTGAAGGVVAAGAAAFLGRSFGGAAAVDEARVNVTLPAAAEKAPPIPAGADFRINGLSPFVTPNRDFYRVDTALIVPQVDPRSWTLRVHGLVDRPIEITFDDLLRRPLVEADVTLTCVSNEVGGPYAGNARWLGVRMADVLREAGLRPEADMLLSTSQDGFTCGTPVDVVMDGRDALFAVGMNGEPLPVDHGFPVRQVVPGLYGYVSATKWVVDVKVTRFDRDEAYWTPRGWAAKGPIKTQSRIDVPKPNATVPPGRTTVAGVAWAQHKGIDAVEVRIDGGAWQQARLAAVLGPDTWRQWAFDWDATPGDHTIEVRATDATGYTQTSERTPVAPDGASGWHTIDVHVG